MYSIVSHKLDEIKKQLQNSDSSQHHGGNLTIMLVLEAAYQSLIDEYHKKYHLQSEEKHNHSEINYPFM